MTRANWQHALRHAWSARSALSQALWPLSWVSAVVVALAQRRAAAQPPAPAPIAVVVVGNLVAGGAGKTPTTLALTAQLQARGERPLILSKGHGRKKISAAPFTVQPNTPAQVAGDEALLMAQSGRAPVVVAPGRRSGIAWALQQHPHTSVIVCDDGLQDHDLSCDVELVVHDVRGLGNGRLLPAGPLREPWPRRIWRRNATTLHALSLAPHETAPELPEIIEPLWLIQRQLCQTVRRLDDTVHIKLDDLAAQPWQALAAIAKPEQFFTMLRALGVDLKAQHAYADHASLDNIHRRLNPNLPLLVTAKDAVKLANWPAQWQVRTWVLQLELDLPCGLVERVLEAVRATRQPLSSRHG